VMTDGRIYVAPDGNETKSFHVRDGLGIRLGQAGGLSFGIITGRRSPAVAARAEELDIAELHQGVVDKDGCLDGILERTGLADDAVAFIGDDLLDVPVMNRVGFAAAPADATAEAREAADYVARSRGGFGVVREVVDIVLRASGAWERVTGRYLK